MRRSYYLIKEAKQSTNTTDVEAISDELCIRYLNRSQEFIQAFLFTKNIESKILRGQSTINVLGGQDTYDLPFNIYAKNSINSVLNKNGNNYSPITQISEKIRGNTVGYFCSDSTIVLSPMPTSSRELLVSFTKRLPSIGKSYGKIKTVNANVSIVLDTGYTSMTLVDDFFTVVDSNGVIITYGIPVSQTTDTLLVADTTGILVGMDVVPGKYATTHPELPDELESSLIMSLETQISARLSSLDLPVSKSFSDEMLTMICDMFSENTTDTFMPPITEYREWV